MKTLAFFFVLMVGSGAAEMKIKRNEEAIRYPMVKADFESAKFSKIYDLVRVNQEKAENRRMRRFKVIQTLEAGKYLAVVPGFDGTLLLVIPGGELVADNSILSVKAVKTEKMHQYKTVMGSMSTIPVWVPAEEEREFTKTEFREKLMAGVIFEIWYPLENESCKTCIGSGKVASQPGRHSQDGKQLCKACAGHGKIQVLQKFEVVWE